MSRVEGQPRRAGKIASFALAGAISLFGIDEVVESIQATNEFNRENPQVSWSEDIVNTFETDINAVIQKKDPQGLEDISNRIPTVKSALRNLDEVSDELNGLATRKLRAGGIALAGAIGLFGLTISEIHKSEKIIIVI